MVTIKLMGGLGNQMFQYAVAKSLAHSIDDNFQLDTTFLLNRLPRRDFVFRGYDLEIFNIKPRLSMLSLLVKFNNNAPYIFQVLINKFRKYTKSKSYFKEVYDYLFDKNIFKLTRDVYLDGYFQSYKYFENISDEIKNDFTFKYPLTSKYDDIVSLINSCDAVCLNVRRADYVVSSLNSDFFGAMSPEYFSKAVDIIKEKLVNPKLFVFSDDLDWCVTNLKLPFETHYVGHEYAGKKFGDYLQLMTLCKHFIIPNSTFAWWGAWLSANPDKIVIAPKQWVRDEKINANTVDLIPQNWIRI